MSLKREYQDMANSAAKLSAYYWRLAQGCLCDPQHKRFLENRAATEHDLSMAWSEAAEKEV